MKPGLEVADVFRDGEPGFLARYGPTLSREQRRAFRAVTQCRTASLGGHVQRCSDCGHEKIQYNSCRNRHCPKCQAMARAAWLAKRDSELLPVPYFHVVFTLPHELRRWRYRTSESPTACCSAPLQGPCWKWPPTRSISGRRSVA